MKSQRGVYIIGEERTGNFLVCTCIVYDFRCDKGITNDEFMMQERTLWGEEVGLFFLEKKTCSMNGFGERV